MQLKEFKADLLPKLHELDFSAKRKILNVVTGNLLTSFKGKGFEFEGYRHFTPEDDASRIDWRASLRTSKLLIREFNVEKNYDVFFLIDVSDSMLFTSTDKLKCEYAAELVSTLAFGVTEAGAGLGFAMLNNKLVCKLAPQLGKKQYHYLLKELQNVNNYGGDFDLEEGIKFLLSFLKQKALVIVVSDFIGLKKNWYKYLQILSHKFELIGIVIRDPRDRQLPKEGGQYVLQDPYSDEKIYIDSGEYAEMYAKETSEEEVLLRRKFTLLKSDFLFLSTDSIFTDSVLKFIKKRGDR
ncbi:MAG: DUF58 domain-containing protein [Nanoarchaeota archaeon]|nr:DUF58 domain-containing protein [Nanoarchaeota archaeon]